MTMLKSRQSLFFSRSDLSLRIRKTRAEDALRIELAHNSGAALIVPSCQHSSGPDGLFLETQGFDGTRFTFVVADNGKTATVTASIASPILGGSTEALLTEAEEHEIAPQRYSGDEETRPIPTATGSKKNPA